MYHIIDMMIWETYLTRIRNQGVLPLYPIDQNLKQISLLSEFYEAYFEFAFLHFRSLLINSYLTELLLHVNSFPII